MGETEAVGQLLKRSQEELEMTRAEVSVCLLPLCQTQAQC